MKKLILISMIFNSMNAFAAGFTAAPAATFHPAGVVAAPGITLGQTATVATKTKVITLPSSVTFNTTDFVAQYDTSPQHNIIGYNYRGNSAFVPAGFSLARPAMGAFFGGASSLTLTLAWSVSGANVTGTWNKIGIVKSTTSTIQSMLPGAAINSATVSGNILTVIYH